MANVIKCGPWIRRFLLEHLVSDRNLARNTQQSYRDTLALLLPFVAKQLRSSGIPSFFEFPRNKRIKMAGKPFRKESKGGHNTGMSA
jgi:site-specific recombinase XerD